ncbi:T9SS type A sorting domain-containing protein [Pontimicrobium aquaticum]|uniref:T9SS type A sorting domain-containing protein n=1 Tax=Pontimicrobium aquaticum TaxID=2565367 RepID=A0A4U0EST3_9FLAO|nr:T9SS type A sorting domain-containing protein [Pontimicrobium aquaticum]TJY34813.1 T9SS type A sorting domain-containing protein [Pontimicrobium aquaticum]
MKTKLLSLIVLFFTLLSNAQTDGWFLYNKPGTVSAIIPDDSNANILHVATDMGYIQYNTSTDMVTDFLNLTSQNPVIANVNGIDVNPTNNDIALALDGGFAIYDGTTVTVYNYDNSALTVGSVGGSQFTKLKVRYGRQGQLYIFKPDVTGYQIFNAGVFDTEVATAIRPQDIIENQAGTKVYFAGWNDGLHELTKATNSWVNYTSSNSDLIYNVLHSLYVDSSDILYIGGFQGLNTMSNSGTWNTYQQLEPVDGVFYYPVYSISRHSTTGDLLINTSKPNNTYFGLTLLELSTNTWTNYRNDGTNCLDENVFNAATFGRDNNIYAAKNSFLFNGEIFKFISGTDTCTQLDINYLNAPTVTTSNFISGIATRTKALDIFDIGFTRGENLHMLEINQDTFSGVFTAATTITPSPGNAAYSVLDDNDFFIVETNNGWTFVDGDNNISEFAHNLPSYTGILTQKAAAYDSDNGIVNLIHKGFDASWNYRVYKTRCNTATGTCTVPIEIFTANRDLSTNVLFDCTTLDGVVTCYGAKPNPTGGSSSRGGSTWLESDNWDATNPSLDRSGDFDDILPTSDFSKDPVLIQDTNNIPPRIGFVPIIGDTPHARNNSGDGSYTPFPLDIDNNGVEDLIKSVSPQEFIPGLVNSVAVVEKQETGESGTFFQFGLIAPLSGSFSLSSGFAIDLSFHDAPNVDIFEVRAATMARFRSGLRVSQEDPVKTTIVLLTNYGIIINPGVEISSNLLNTNDIILKEKNLLLYPNPANNMVSFSNKSISNYEIFDINGRSIIKSQGNSFSVKTLAKGIYIVKTQTTDKVVLSKKLIVN